LDLLVVADSVGGGLGAAASAHARWFADRGWSVGLAAPEAKAPDDGAIEALALASPGSAFNVSSMLAAASRLRAEVVRTRPRVVHAHGTRSQLLVLLAGRRPYVTMHGSGGRIDGQRALGTAVRRAGRQLASRLAIRAYSAAPSTGRWQTLLHASPRLAELARSPLPAHPVTRFLWLGRLDAPKQPETFIRACALAAQQRPVRGVMLGDGPMMAACRSLALDLKAPVEFLGERTDVAHQLAQASALCLFSGFEGIPFAVQEAMWVGRPVLLSPLPSLRWFAADAAGYAEDAEAAAEAMVQLCDRDIAVERGESAAARVRALLSPDAPFPQLMRDYSERSAITDR
jgi:glycosyltransferase involved in cell wall biosynthesis